MSGDFLFALTDCMDFLAQLGQLSTTEEEDEDKDELEEEPVSTLHSFSEAVTG